MTKHKASKNEQWLNYDIGNPDFQRLFRRVKGFYKGSLQDVIKVPDDLTPILDRAMGKFHFSSKYEALLYVLTLRSCEYVADFISGTMYDYAVDHALKDLSYDELRQSYNILEEDEDKEKSFKNISYNSALSVASFLKYITGNLSVSSRKENFSVNESVFSFLGETPDPTDEIPIEELHALAVIWARFFPGEYPSDVFRRYAGIKGFLLSGRDPIKALTEEKEELLSKLKEKENLISKYEKEKLEKELHGSGFFRTRG